MRTIKLTHEQIELITHALGIAESEHTNKYKDIINNLVRVRGNTGAKEQEMIAKYYHVKACEFADLNTDITKGGLDA